MNALNPSIALLLPLAAVCPWLALKTWSYGGVSSTAQWVELISFFIVAWY